jgi:urease accessory protein
VSLALSLVDRKLSARKTSLPSRFFHFSQFSDQESYMKLLTIGEGIFPRDRVNTAIELTRSNLVVATETAAKAYPSDRAENFAANRLHFSLRDGSNLEYLGDELILFRNARFMQFLRVDFDDSATFFISDLFSYGRSFEPFSFACFWAQNRFFLNGALELIERFIITGGEIKNYLARHSGDFPFFGKIYMRSRDNDALRKTLNDDGFSSVEYSSNNAILIAIVLGESVASVKAKRSQIWRRYRERGKKAAFDLGKF